VAYSQLTAAEELRRQISACWPCSRDVLDAGVDADYTGTYTAEYGLVDRRRRAGSR
jgi:hypothetical protein